MDTNNIISQLQDIMANAEHDSIRETIAQVCGISDMTDEQEQTIAAYEAEYLRVLRETSAMYPEDDGDSIDHLWQIMDQHVEDTAAALVKELTGRSYVKWTDKHICKGGEIMSKQSKPNPRRAAAPLLEQTTGKKSTYNGGKEKC